MGKYVFPHKRICIVNSNRGKQIGILGEVSPGISYPKEYPSWRPKELFPRCQQDNSNKDLSWRQNELFSWSQQNQRGTPKKEYLRISNPKEDPSWRQKEVISKCQRDNSNKDLSWHQKKVITRYQQENFVPTKCEVWVLNFGRGVEYSKIWRNGFPFARLTFLLSQQSVNKTDVAKILNSNSRNR